MHEQRHWVRIEGSDGEAVREPKPRAADALTVRTERRADVLVLWLTGALDRATSGLLDREFDAQAGHAPHVVLDLTGVALIDASGLETLVRTQRRAAENHQRTSFRQGRHAGRLPLELTRDVGLRSWRASRRVGVGDENEYFALAVASTDVDHQRPLVIDPEAPWMGALGQAAGASDAPAP